jgi:hypothetical protein
VDAKFLLQCQHSLERTRDGRVIGESLRLILADAVRADTVDPSTLLDCCNCGLVLDEDYFAAGCPNCHSKDVLPFRPHAPTIQK